MDPVDEITPEQDDGDAEAQALERSEQLQAFGRALAKTRDDWVRARAATGWDKRVQIDLDQYHMKDAASKQAASMMDAVQQGYPVSVREAKPTRSTLFIGVTRQRTNAAEARLADILLPTDDRNWGIKPTPDPECAIALQDETTLVDPATGQPVMVDETGAVTLDPERGRPVRKKDIAIATQRVAKMAADGMLQEIDDQLVECDYLGENRKVLHDAAVMGTGVLKGPIVTKKVRKAWRERVDPATGKKVHELQVVEDLKPASFRVDPRMVWEDPACGDDVKNGQGVFELEQKTERRVRELAKQPGYMREQLLKVLAEGPKQGPSEIELTREDAQHYDKDRLFNHWTYWGELKREDLEVAGVELPEDELEVTSGCVEMINDTVVRAFLNPLDTGDIPYDFYPWEKVQGSCRGYGVPYLMRAEQSATNAAWRQMMDNSGITAGPQIIVNKRIVKPADNQWSLRPFKFWDLSDDSVDPAKAFFAVEFNSHQRELAGILELAQKLGDQGSGIPMLVAGEKGSSPETVGGMQLLMNSANVVLRRLVKQYDDYITKPHIRRYYDYNMAYSEKDSIKGDFVIDARGSSALVVRDVQNQAYLQLLAAGANPVYSPYIDIKKLFEKGLQAQHIDPRDILLPDEKIEENLQKPPPPDPRIEATKINAEARLMQARAVAEGRATEVEVLRENEAENRRMRLLELQLKRDLAVMEYATLQKISLDEVKAKLAQSAIADRTKKELAASEMVFKQRLSPDGQGI